VSDMENYFISYLRYSVQPHFGSAITEFTLPCLEAAFIASQIRAGVGQKGEIIYKHRGISGMIL
jgi:hypothetical protein